VFLVCWRGKSEKGRAVSNTFSSFAQFSSCGLDLRYDLVPGVYSHGLVCRSLLTCVTYSLCLGAPRRFLSRDHMCIFLCACLRLFVNLFVSKNSISIPRLSSSLLHICITQILRACRAPTKSGLIDHVVLLQYPSTAIVPQLLCVYGWCIDTSNNNDVRSHSYCCNMLMMSLFLCFVLPFSIAFPCSSPPLSVISLFVETTL
jgi:hypothetical protein